MTALTPFRFLAVLATLTLVFTSCSSDDDDEAEAPAAEDTVTTADGPINEGQVIDVVDFGFDPNPITIEEGEVVTFTNTSETTTHAIEHLPSPGQDILFSATRLGPGESFTVMPELGPVEYHCQIHPETMQGGFIVVPAGGGSTDTTAAG